MAETSLHHLQILDNRQVTQGRTKEALDSVSLAPSAVAVSQPPSQPLHISTFITSPILEQVDRGRNCAQNARGSGCPNHLLAEPQSHLQPTDTPPQCAPHGILGTVGVVLPLN